MIRLLIGWLTFVVIAAISLSCLPSAKADCFGRQRVVISRQQVIYPLKQQVVYPIKQQVVYPEYYYSLSTGYREDLLADAIVGRLIRTLNLQVAPTQPQQNNVAPNNPANTSAGLAAVVQKSCIRCHSQTKADGGLSLDNLNAVSEGQRWKAYGLVVSGEMPKQGEPVSDQETKLFYDWARGK